ncbi:polymorphic toxin type 35 domain-containing protein [Alkalihalobacillus alcalophilus]|uniref:polymorphic toxin type 35 domain-containing protein n=1 Tax=Alkalihalobacillus alcalophilus TaxID=1445 RepID=UPI0038B2AB18
MYRKYTFNWKLVTNNKWDDVAKVMPHGKKSAYKRNDRQKTIIINGRGVVVTFVRDKDVVKISNGWVK